MPFLYWSEQYSVGIAIFDAEHKRLFTLANDLYDAIVSGRVDETLHSFFNGLIKYSNQHFDHEEEYFQLALYPAGEAHRQYHDWLRKQILQFQSRLTDTPKDILAIELAKFLKDWVYNHILKDDVAYGRFLNDKGIH